jgi:hypothetical protein
MACAWTGRSRGGGTGGCSSSPASNIEGPEFRKRTALYEIKGNFEGGPLSIKEWGELPSAGDTSYAGVAPLGGSRFLITWYSSPLAGDPSWLEGFQGQTDIWQATLDLGKL